MTRAYYNEIDPAAAHILRAMVDTDVIAPGDVDTRSIKEVQPDDVASYTQCHFFAGGGLWSVAARLAGWPDDRPLWTGSCPCQPFSAAGKGLGTDDPRHLWPDFHRLIRACRPPVVMGEQVAGKAGYGWFDGVSADLAGEDYASRAVDFPACSVDAPHQRNRLYWIAVNGRVADHDRLGSAAFGRNSGEVGSIPAQECWTKDDALVSRRSHDQAFGLVSGADTGSELGDGCCQRFSRGPFAEVRRGNIREKGATSPASDAGNGRLSSNSIVSLLQGQSSARNKPDLGTNESLHADANGHRCDGPGLSARPGWERLPYGARHPQRNGTYWSDADWIECRDGKARRAQSGIRDVAHGLPGRMDQDGRGCSEDIQEIPRGFLVQGMIGRVDLWRVAGNAIVPEAAAEVISAFMETYGVPYQG